MVVGNRGVQIFGEFDEMFLRNYHFVNDYFLIAVREITVLLVEEAAVAVEMKMEEDTQEVAAAA